ncbi:MAG: TonB-dependent receptor [Cyclobacteriaceae bacterium]
MKKVKHLTKMIAELNGIKELKFYLLIVVFLCSSILFGQDREVTGTVSDAETGERIPGATVLIKGTSTGTVTDFDGNFSLVANSEQVLQVSFVGYMAAEVPVANKTNLTISLQLDVKALDEVVVVGYGSVRKSDLTGAVASVDIESLEKFASVDVTRSLQGKVAGVQVTTNSGAPGAATTVRVRGVGSFGNADPLYVVDGFLTGDIGNISPNDIESMEVLKDASATAIYGSRGANGVIIITTKKGKKDGFEIELNAYGGIQNAWQTQDLLNAEEYAELYVESFSGPGDEWDINEIDDLGRKSWIRDALSGAVTGTDWQDEVLRTGRVQNYNLSIRGGFGPITYNIGGTYFDQEGIVGNTNGDTKRTIANITFQPIDKLKVVADLKYSDYSFTEYDQGTYTSVLGVALRKDPVNPVRDPITGFWDRTGLTDLPNPARLLYEQQFREASGDRSVGGFSIEYELIDGLTLKSVVTYDKTKNDRRILIPANSTIESRFLVDGEAQISPNESLSADNLFLDERTKTVLQNSNTIGYNKVINKHSINAVIGFESYQQRDNRLQTQNDGGELPDKRRYSILSLFSRFNYSFDNRYLFTATIRRDGSSKFPKDGQWGTFPSFSLGWNVDREAFFTENKYVSGIKLRTGWGRVGNQDPISPYGFYTTLAPGWDYPLDNETSTSGYASDQLPASTLTWETSETSNLGLDLLFFDDRLSVTTDYFIRKTKDLLVGQLPVPNFAGARGPRSNAASMTNQGLELSLDLKQQFSDFSFNVGGNISFIKNEVTDLGAGDVITGADYESKIGMPVTRTVVGEEFASFYGLRVLGIFQNEDEVNSHRLYNASGQPIDLAGNVVEEFSDDHRSIQARAKPGDVKYDDVNNDGVIDQDDAVSLGSAIPDFTYGFYMSATYKAFDLSLSFTGVQGNEIANIFTFYNEGASAGENNFLRSRFDRWTGEGTSNTEPRVTSDNTDNGLFSERYIEDGSFLRLRNVQLGYTLPKNITKKVKMSSARVYISADNLLTFTKYSGLDPEVGLPFNDAFGAGVDLGNYPLARTFFIGTSIKF